MWQEKVKILLTSVIILFQCCDFLNVNVNVSQNMSRYVGTACNVNLTCAPYLIRNTQFVYYFLVYCGLTWFKENWFRNQDGGISICLSSERTTHSYNKREQVLSFINKL